MHLPKLLFVILVALPLSSHGIMEACRIGLGDQAVQPFAKPVGGFRSFQPLDDSRVAASTSRIFAVLNIKGNELSATPRPVAGYLSLSSNGKLQAVHPDEDGILAAEIKVDANGVAQFSEKRIFEEDGSQRPAKLRGLTAYRNGFVALATQAGGPVFLNQRGPFEAPKDFRFDRFGRRVSKAWEPGKGLLSADLVNFLVSADGKKAVSIDQSGKIYVLDGPRWKLRRTFEFHGEYIASTLSVDGNHLCIAVKQRKMGHVQPVWEQTLYEWDLNLESWPSPAGRILDLGPEKSHRKIDISSLAYAPDRRQIAIGTVDGSILIRDSGISYSAFSSYRLVGGPFLKVELKFSPSGDSLFASTGDALFHIDR